MPVLPYDPTLAEPPSAQLPDSPALQKARIQRALAQIQDSGDRLKAGISSPWQGFASLADAAFGGLDLHLLNKEDKAQREKFGRVLADDPRLRTDGEPAPAAPAAPTRTA